MLLHLLRRLFVKNSIPALRYQSNGRSGYVWYQDAEGELSFYYEFGGGDCIASIYVPEGEAWTKETGRTPESRASIVTLVAENAVKDQISSNGYYEVEDGWIHLYKND